MTKQTTSQAAWNGLNLQGRETEALNGIEALMAQGFHDVTRNELDSFLNAQLEAQGRVRRTSPSWGARLKALTEKGILVRTTNRRCRASASTTSCRAYTLADAAPTRPQGRVIQLAAILGGSSSMGPSWVRVLDEEAEADRLEFEPRGSDPIEPCTYNLSEFLEG